MIGPKAGCRCRSVRNNAHGTGPGIYRPTGAAVEHLTIALYDRTDDPLKASPHLAPCRPAVGITQQLTDAALVTLATMQAMLGFTSEARWLCARPLTPPSSRGTDEACPRAW